MQITEVEYASYLSYTPRPQSEEQRSSKDVTLMLKNNEMWRGTLLSASEHIIRQMAKKVDRLPFYDFFRGKPLGADAVGFLEKARLAVGSAARILGSCQERAWERGGRMPQTNPRGTKIIAQPAGKKTKSNGSL